MITKPEKFIFIHFEAILGQFLAKLCDFQIPLFLGPVYLHGLVLASKWSISSILSRKCNRFPWKFIYSTILSHKSGSSASPQISIFSAFSQFSNSRSGLSCLNDRLGHYLHISCTSHHDFLIWLLSICEKNVFFSAI